MSVRYARRLQSLELPSLPAIVLALFLVVCFAFGGSARGDVKQLTVLWPLSSLALACGFWTLRWPHIRRYRFLFAMAAAMIALPALQLIPLPPEIWSKLPGRGLIVEIDRVAELGRVWRPISMTPFETKGALFSLTVPLAVLVLGAQLKEGELRAMLPVVIVLGFASAMLGLLQIEGPPHGPLYLFPIVHDGFAVGFFANRNHEALLLATLLPMVATYIAQLRGDRLLLKIVLGLAGLVLVPMVLVTGSRMGLLLMVLALLSLPFVAPIPWKRWLAKRPPAPRRRRLILEPQDINPRMLVIAGAAVAIILGMATVWLNRGVAVERLSSVGTGTDLRFTILPTLFMMIRLYFSFGSGMGSFEKVYQVHEPDVLLGPNYMNHAHNDWLEVALDGGLFGIALLVLAVVGYVLAAYRSVRPGAAVSSRALRIKRLGIIAILLASIASTVDYPLRTPLMASVFALAALWAAGQGGRSDRARAPNDIQSTT